jgi:hypothetical protein
LYQESVKELKKRKVMESKFKIKDNRPLSQKVGYFLEGLLFWKGRSKGMVYTRDIDLDDIREVFFPNGFEEKYSYLGSVPHNEDSEVFKAMYPLILAMDYEAKPKWCPRWFLRFLHLFGNDKSIVRVRNFILHNLFKKLTKGIMIWDYKTKWEWYDLRISISAPKHLQDLASAIESDFYSRGRQEDIAKDILELDPKASIIWGSVDRLIKQYNELVSKKSEQNKSLKKMMKEDEDLGLYDN